MKAILRKERNDYGKAIRKRYEKGEIKEMRKTMSRWEPRPDGLSNTITSVWKDNLLIEYGAENDSCGNA